MKKILIIDDEKNIREGLQKSFSLDGFGVLTAQNGKEGLEVLAKEGVDVVICDLRMPEMSGEVFIEQAKKIYPDIPVIILTGHGTVDNAVETMRKGAYDFFTKPVNLKKMLISVNRALENVELKQENAELKKNINDKYLFENIIGTSSKMQQVYEVVKQVAPSKANILIEGDSGTGKELIANAIHCLSDRKDKPLIKVHCAALNENLLESELFGHEKGSFTGAINQKKGKFESADGGTIFLDEIGEISTSTQVKLLRVIQEREFDRVGGVAPIKVDVRIIAATNRDLQEEVKKGNFREDLFYRLKVISINMPRLKDRPSDIPLLINAFVKEFAEINGRQNITISPKALAMLEGYNWPGNVRELRNVIEGAVVMCKGGVINDENLPWFIKDNQQANTISLDTGISLSEAEKRVIYATLAMTKGNKSKAAEVLKIGRKTLHRKLEEYEGKTGSSDDADDEE
jgi:DNA-binding NtrC family response regulator